MKSKGNGQDFAFLAKIAKDIFVLTLNLGAGEVAGRLEQLHEGKVEVEGGNDPAHPGVKAQGFLFHRVQGPDIRCWVRLTRDKEKNQCSGSKTCWCGSGSADPCL